MQSMHGKTEERKRDGNMAAEYVKTLKSEFTGSYRKVIMQHEFQKSWNVL